MKKEKGMADQAVLKYLSIGTTFDPCYLSLDSTFNVKTGSLMAPNQAGTMV